MYTQKKKRKEKSKEKGKEQRQEIGNETEEEQQMTQGPYLVADGWAGASNPKLHSNPTPPTLSTLSNA